MYVLYSQSFLPSNIYSQTYFYPDHDNSTAIRQRYHVWYLLSPNNFNSRLRIQFSRRKRWCKCKVITNYDRNVLIQVDFSLVIKITDVCPPVRPCVREKKPHTDRWMDGWKMTYRKSLSQSVIQSVNQSVCHSFSLSFSQSVSQSISQSVSQSFS